MEDSIMFVCQVKDPQVWKYAGKTNNWWWCSHLAFHVPSVICLSSALEGASQGNHKKLHDWIAAIGINYWRNHREPTQFKRMIHQQEACALLQKDTLPSLVYEVAEINSLPASHPKIMITLTNQSEKYVCIWPLVYFRHHFSNLIYLIKL